MLYLASSGQQIDFYVIASDSGLLTKPTRTSDLLLSMGERYEIVVDFSPFQGRNVDLLNTLSFTEQDDYHHTDKVMRFVVGRRRSRDSSLVPSTLREVPWPTSKSGVDHRFVFDHGGGEWRINGITFMDVRNRVLAKPDRGLVEVWELENHSGGASHPVHIHLVDFRIIGRSLGRGHGGGGDGDSSGDGNGDDDGHGGGDGRGESDGGGDGGDDGGSDGPGGHGGGRGDGDGGDDGRDDGGDDGRGGGRGGGHEGEDNGASLLAASIRPYESAGLKDVVWLGPGEKVMVEAHYSPWPGVYMFHCHNLIHEDHMMMAAFNVSTIADLGYNETNYVNPMDQRWRPMQEESSAYHFEAVKERLDFMCGFQPYDHAYEVDGWLSSYWATKTRNGDGRRTRWPSTATATYGPWGTLADSPDVTPTDNAPNLGTATSGTRAPEET